MTLYISSWDKVFLRLYASFLIINVNVDIGRRVSLSPLSIPKTMMRVSGARCDALAIGFWYVGRLYECRRKGAL